MAGDALQELNDYLYEQATETGPDDLPVDTIEAQIIEHAIGHIILAMQARPDLVLRALNLRLCGYLCPECHTWAEDMTPHCFNEHADDPVETLPFYLDDRMRKV